MARRRNVEDKRKCHLKKERKRDLYPIARHIICKYTIRSNTHAYLYGDSRKHTAFRGTFILVASTLALCALHKIRSAACKTRMSKRHIRYKQKPGAMLTWP